MGDQSARSAIRKTGMDVPTGHATVAVSDTHVRYQTSSTERPTPRRETTHPGPRPVLRESPRFRCGP